MGVFLICHKHRCLFLHVPKVAGKSVLAVFGLPLKGSEYIKAPIPWIADPYGHFPITRYYSADWFNEYFKFAFVRNPFDRLVSAFFFLSRGGLNQGDQKFAEDYLEVYELDFKRFVAEGLESVMGQMHFRPQVSWLCGSSQKPEVDFLGRFEDFERDLERVASHLGIPLDSAPHLNASQRELWSEYYDEETKRRVSELYSADFDILGYSVD